MTKQERALSNEEVTARLAATEARLVALADEFARYRKSTGEYEEVIRRYLKLHDRDVAYLFERLQCLELNSYPSLAANIGRIDDVIGDSDPRADNPLDRRSTSQ